MSRWERVTQFKGKHKTRFVVWLLRVVRVNILVNVSHLAKFYTEQANVELTWRKLRAKMECYVFAWVRYSCVPRALHTLSTFSALTEISPVSAFNTRLFFFFFLNERTESR